MDNRVESVEKRRVRSGELSRHEVTDAQQVVSIQCRGIGALAVYVNTVDGMRWRCNRCGAQVKVVA